MKSITARDHHYTSVTLPRGSFRRLDSARKIFARNGIHLSNQALYRFLFKHYLKNWRGRRLKSNSLRRYNADGKNYSIHALYINKVLHSALSQRANHSGESLSRILDVAIRVYLPRLIEEVLQSAPPRPGGTNNAYYWAARYARRSRRYSDLFVIYHCFTQANDGIALKYTETTKILTKEELLDGKSFF